MKKFVVFGSVMLVAVSLYAQNTVRFYDSTGAKFGPKRTVENALVTGMQVEKETFLLTNETVEVSLNGPDPISLDSVLFHYESSVNSTCRVYVVSSSMTNTVFEDTLAAGTDLLVGFVDTPIWLDPTIGDKIQFESECAEACRVYYVKRK